MRNKRKPPKQKQLNKKRLPKNLVNPNTFNLAVNILRLIAYLVSWFDKE